MHWSLNWVCHHDSITAVFRLLICEDAEISHKKCMVLYWGALLHLCPCEFWYWYWSRYYVLIDFVNSLFTSLSFLSLHLESFPFLHHPSFCVCVLHLQIPTGPLIFNSLPQQQLSQFSPQQSQSATSSPQQQGETVSHIYIELTITASKMSQGNPRLAKINTSKKKGQTWFISIMIKTKI